MKKFIIMLSCCVLLFCSLFMLTACNINNNNNGNGANGGSSGSGTIEEPIQTTSDNILVVYFSCTNNTKDVASKIATKLNCSTFEITPLVPYTSEDLNYSNSNSRANQEQNNASARPQIANSINNLDDYNVIFIGYPIWWGKLPKIIYTFCESYDFSEKIIIPFCTSGSSGISTSVNELKQLEPNANIYNGQRFSSGASQETINTWVESLNIKTNRGEYQMNIYVNGRKLTATMEDNSSAKALKELLESGDIIVNMRDYANFEKVGDLPQSLPTNDTQITTTAGDIILYQGYQITIYYNTNTWNFTKLGKINNISQNELKNILGTGNVQVKLSLN